MATATQYNPKARPENLERLDKGVGKPPVNLTSTEPDAVFEWAEACRDAVQKQGKLLTARGLLGFIRNNISDEETQKAMRKVIKQAYASELTESAAPVKSTKTGGKKKPKAKAAAKAKPSKNGKAKAESAPAAEAEVVLDTKVNGIPVRCTQTDTGRRRPMVDGLPAREVLRWMGSKGFDVPGATKVMNKLFAGLKDEEYVTGFCVEGHVGSGRKGKDGAFGEFGAPSKEVQRALLGMKK